MLNNYRFFVFIAALFLFSCGQAPEGSENDAPQTSAEQTVDDANGAPLSRWEKGVHYTVYSDEATSKPEVVEYFSFWCPSCYNFEPIAEQINQSLSDNVAFEKVHVYFMGFTTPEVQNEATRGMMIGRYLKQSNKLNAAIFHHIHREGKTIGGLADVRALFIANGISAEDFDAAAASEDVNAMVRRNNDAIERNRYYVTGVPTLLINGKYKPMFNRDMTIDDMTALVIWLASQK